MLVTDGPYTETKEHMGGFWILEAADMDEALTEPDRTRRNTVMRKIVVLEQISLDGVIQAPGGPEEDTSDGFAYAGGLRRMMTTYSSRPCKPSCANQLYIICVIRRAA